MPSSAKPKLEALASGLVEVSFFFRTSQPGKVSKLEIKLQKNIPNQMTSIEEDLIGRQPQWKTTSMEDDHKGGLTQRKTTSNE